VLIFPVFCLQRLLFLTSSIHLHFSTKKQRVYRLKIKHPLVARLFATFALIIFGCLNIQAVLIWT